jgi:hypothetical protein
MTERCKGFPPDGVLAIAKAGEAIRKFLSE